MYPQKVEEITPQFLSVILDTPVHSVTYKSLKSQATNARSEMCVWLLDIYTNNDVIPLVAKKAISEGTKLEVLVYREILDPYHLPAPKLYYSIFEPSHSCYWIFISYENSSLIELSEDPWDSYCESICESIAQVHWTFKDKNIEKLFPWLKGNSFKQLESSYIIKVQSQLRKLPELNIEFPEAFMKHLSAFIEQLPSIATFINDLPLTITHGDFATFNMLLHGERVFLYDWEGTAFQPAARDIAQLTHHQGIFNLDPIVNAYVDARKRLGESPQEAEQLREQCDKYQLWLIATILSGIVAGQAGPYAEAMLYEKVIFYRSLELLTRWNLL